jgi:MFS family permease
MITVTLGSVLCATAPSVEILIIYRVIQGIGAAMLFANGAAILVSVFPPERRGYVLGFTISAVYFGLTLGPLIGGWCTQYLTWRSVFIVHLPIVLVMIGLTFTLLRVDWAGNPDQKFDLAGSLIYGAGIITLIYGLSTLPALRSLWIIGAGIIGLVAFIQFEKRTASPIFEVNLFFTNRLFLFSCLAALILYTSSFGLSYLMSLHLQYIKGLGPQASGAVIMSQPVMMALFSPLAGRLSDRYEPRHLASAGMLIMISGFLALSSVSPHTPLYLIVVFLLLTGTGFALFSSPNVNAIMSSVDKKHLGVASGATSTIRVVGQMFSMAIVTLVFALVMGPVRITPEQFSLLEQSIKTCFLISAGLCTVGIYFSLSRGNLRKEKI